MTGYRDMTFCDAAERWWGREMKFNEEGFKDILRSYGLSDYGIEEVKRQLIRDALRWKHQADSSEPGKHRTWAYAGSLLAQERSKLRSRLPGYTRSSLLGDTRNMPPKKDTAPCIETRSAGPSSRL